jgi:ABC-type transport system involved in multi-copper enzyme maturation permease subunit
LKPILTIALAGVREHLRRKFLLFFVGILLAVTAGMIYLTYNRSLSGALFSAAVNLVNVASLSFMFFIAALTTIAVSMGNIGRPFSDGEAMLILARPLSRWQYAMGRLLGSVLVVLTLCLLMAGQMQVVQLFEDTQISSQLPGHWATTAFNLTLLAAITTLLSSLLNTPILVAIGAYLVYQALGAISVLNVMAKSGILRGWMGAAIRIAYFLSPKTLTSPLTSAQLAEAAPRGAGVPSPPSTSTGSTLMAFVYLAAIVLATALVVQRKDL